MRRATGVSSLSSSLWARGSNSIVHFGPESIGAHYFFEGNGPNAASVNLCQTLFGKVNIFQIVEVLKDGLPCVVGFGSARALGEAVQALFDFVGKADSQHRATPVAIQL